MGVPALFRWLSKKYPKIVQKVVEEPHIEDMTGANPNGSEFDCLYLDMNAIVHPCTHPEGKPAPETEEEMMAAIFQYTDRVVNMIRPRKLLMLAIDGVAPRAKMNQQRSRRFRAAREAKEKDDAYLEGVEIFREMGKEVQEGGRKKTWDTNAITPGTPFMDFLASSLRYWITLKLNNDPGWAGIQVILSDASVPGEGEHKIMDYIRRQRTHDAYDHNTKHVIYGLDADLIMLALATHEMHFNVLREDVFAQADKPGQCRKCAMQGHIAAHCPNSVFMTPKAVTDKDGNKDEEKKEEELKPFIFLNVSVLREYLLSELSLPAVSFFDLERAIDDWVLLIFFVGNDFLPHLPSLEIREGAIDTLLRIWKAALPAMGGYVTDNGKLDMPRLSFILEGLAQEEDKIFQRRKEAEERQDANAKRRKMEQEALALAQVSPAHTKLATPTNKSKAAIKAAAAAFIPADLIPAKKHALPARPLSEIARAKLDEDAKKANLSAAEKLRNELATDDTSADDNSDVEIVKVEKPSPESAAVIEDPAPVNSTAQTIGNFSSNIETESDFEKAVLEVNPISNDIPLVENANSMDEAVLNEDFAKIDSVDASSHISEEVEQTSGPVSNRVSALKRKADTLDNVDSDQDEDTSVGCATPVPMSRVKNPDGTVDQEDTVKLWEPGYKTRYYEQKFGKNPEDVAFRNQLVECYLEGLSWVLAYYYQGCPSWQWFYPYHYAPFAADFQEISSIKIEFTLGQPFKPFEQLMGVFPASSGIHIPVPFRRLMVEDDSPILDFYPEEFEIDMNGKKMEWQGIALLPFIDQDKLLPALETRASELTEDEVKRNTMGHTSVFVSEMHPLFSTFCSLYGKRKTKSIEIGGEDSSGLSGILEPDPDFIPSSSYDTPLPSLKNMGDIPVNGSIVSRFVFPIQRVPHRSVMLPRSKRPTPALSPADHDFIKFGGYERRDGSNSNRGNSRGRGGYRNNGDRSQYDSRPSNNHNNTQSYQQPYTTQSNYNRSAPSSQPTSQSYNTPGPAAFATYQDRLRNAGRQQQPLTRQSDGVSTGYSGYGGYGGSQNAPHIPQPIYGGHQGGNYGGSHSSQQQAPAQNYGGYGHNQPEARPAYRHSYGGSNGAAPTPNHFQGYPQQPGVAAYGGYQNSGGYQSQYAAPPQYPPTGAHAQQYAAAGQHQAPPQPPAAGYGGYGLNQRPQYR